MVDGGPAPDRTVLSELLSIRQQPRRLRAAYYGAWKLLWDLDANTYELYALGEDPLDQEDLAGDRPDVLADMRQRLDRASDLELTLLEPDRTR